MASTHSFADLLRTRTAALHDQAERSGVVHDILVGRVNRGSYALFLHNLLPAYRALEAGLQQHHARAGALGVGALHHAGLLRAAAIERDLAALSCDGPRDLPALPEGERYARRVEAAAAGDGVGLIAHAYTRYLGDLAGGRVLGRRVGAALGLPPAALSFYTFPGIDDVPAFARAYRSTIDALGDRLGAPESVIEEAAVAFALNIALSEAVAAG